MATLARRILAVTIASVLVVGASAADPAPAAADSPPVVTVSPGAVTQVTGPGGTCYQGDVTDERPDTFVVARTGPTDQALVIRALRFEYFGGDGVAALQDEIEIPAGATSVAIPVATDGGASRVLEGRWDLELDPSGDYLVGDPATATVTGLLPADPTLAEPCPRTRRAKTATVVAGERLPRAVELESTGEARTLVDGALPPGTSLIRTAWGSLPGGPTLPETLRGTPGEAGRYRFTVRDCPLPAVGQRTCGTTTWHLDVLAPKPRALADVPPGRWFHRAVYWLFDRDVTTGCAPTRFCPSAAVTRGQTATFLHRLAGRPAPAPGDRFGDVPAGSYFDAATRWLRGTGLTTGIDGADRYAPEEPTTRAQFVTLLWRMAGAPDAFGDDAPFVDVPRAAYFRAAVWFARNWGITTGVGGSDRFDPHRPVTRAEAAAFLVRYASGPGGGVLPVTPNAF